MKADAIIFDKDGTLLDFDAFWVTISVKAMEDILMRFDTPDVPIYEILESFGVHDGITDIEGILCKGTYKQMGQIVYDILCTYGCTASCNEVTNAVIEAYNQNADAGNIKATCPDLVQILTHFKEQNKKLAIVTTDNKEITLKCLRKLGIEELFDKIYTDDGKMPTKPNPYCITDFCKNTGISPKNIVMVGDTMTDMHFAKNAGITAIALAATDKSCAVLSPLADAVIPSLSKLPDILD